MVATEFQVATHVSYEGRFWLLDWSMLLVLGWGGLPVWKVWSLGMPV
jgi:hypothetical protein